VRRAFLCGKDEASGRNFDHSKDWVVELLASLTRKFAVRICAYVVLSNHFHLVVRIESETARNWSDDEVVRSYGRLFRGAKDPRKHFAPARAAERIRCWRARLPDLSWFMRCLNEAIARRANLEDGCSGRIWEGRFRSQALLDEAGLLTCMSYVDLNPIRAGIAASLGESEFTSIRQRIAEKTTVVAGGAATRSPETDPGAAGCEPNLIAFGDAESPANEEALPIELDDYINLLTATGVALRSGVPGATMPDAAVRTLHQLGIARRHWVETILSYNRRFFVMVGGVHAIDIYCGRTDRSRPRGRCWAARAFRAAA